LFSSFRQFSQVGGQRVERRFDIADQGLPENFPMLGFRPSNTSRALISVISYGDSEIKHQTRRFCPESLTTVGFAALALFLMPLS
jgi:hypothetical protein